MDEPEVRWWDLLGRLERSQFCRDALPTISQNSLSLLARDAFECFQEIIQRKPVRQVIEKRLHWQTRALEDRCAAKDARIRHHQPTGSAFDFCDGAHESKAKLSVAKWQAVQIVWTCLVAFF